MLSWESLFKRHDFNLFLKQAKVGQNVSHQGIHSKPWEHQKQSSGQSAFFIYVQMDRIEEPARTFYLDGCTFSILTIRMVI